MIRRLRTFWAIFAIAARRLWANRWLTAVGGLGFVAATALAFALPVYADSVYQRVLNQRIGADAQQSTVAPPFAFMFNYDTWTDYDAADQFIAQEAPSRIGLPLKNLLRYFQTGSMRLYASETVTNNTPGKPLLWTPITSIGQFADHINLVDGAMPAPLPAGQRVAGPGMKLPRVEALVSRELAKALGMYVGRDYVLLSSRTQSVKVSFIVAGIWEKRDYYDPYWAAYQPETIAKMIFVPEQTFVGLAPGIKRDVTDAQWFLDFDGRGVRVWDVDPFIKKVNALMAETRARNLGISLGLSPTDRLLAYQRDSRRLTAQLYAFSVPIFVLVFSFIILVAGLMANNRRGEIAVIRSRGATGWQVIGISTLEAIALASAGAALGAPLALLIAQAVGQTRSFLTFGSGELLPVMLTAAGLPIGIGVAAVAALITVLPIVGASRLTILSYKLERARSLKPAWWQRMGLDLLLLIPAGYWSYLLFKQGAVDIAGSNAASTDPFSNPSLFLLPALTIFALSLLYVRLAPAAVRILAWIGSRLPGTTLVMATRQLARSPGVYVTPIFLLTMTLALATFTASVASTLDAHLEQQARYDLGGDVRIIKTGENRTSGGWAGGGNTSLPSVGSLSISTGDTASTEDTAGATVDLGPRYSFLPLSDYQKIQAVQAVARAGIYPCTLRYASGGDDSCQFQGVDRADYASVAYWRRDFAREPLGTLMNALGRKAEGVLVPESAMAAHALNIGDLLSLKIYMGGGNTELTFEIVGAFKLWPTWYPNRDDAGVMIVGNLDYLFEIAGGQYPYDVWLKAAPGADTTRILADARAIDKQMSGARDLSSVIESEQTRPERQGLFGMLSIGFGAAALFTVLGFTLYSIFSLRRRTIELGVLRAVGLSTLQMSSFLACELALLLVAGIVGGTLFGVLSSRLYIPYLQSAATRSLPFQVLIDWTQVYLVYALFGLIFLIALAALMAYLRQLRIFQAVKLGETE